MQTRLNRWRVVEIWLAACAAFSAVLALTTAAPSLTMVTVLVALSLVPVASVLLWWPADERPLPLEPLRDAR